mmetsp:Transcript_35862/g.85504  ORF Transcript_35862/g.85504 Transcript_35862/m.85504 type:complete len:101 (+) Transcript_35862:969-1271(+)
MSMRSKAQRRPHIDHMDLLAKRKALCGCLCCGVDLVVTALHSCTQTQDTNTSDGSTVFIVLISNPSTFDLKLKQPPMHRQSIINCFRIRDSPLLSHDWFS